MAAQRFITDLAKSDSRWFYVPDLADEVCRVAQLFRHEKGRLQGQRFHLEPWQVFILCNIFGFVDEQGTRKYREAFLLVPRGNGKSPLAAIIGLWMTFFDGEPGAETYCGAASEDQAHEVFRPARAMLEQSPELTSRYGITVAAKSLYQASTRSRFRPVIRQPKDGASVYCAILDEWHQALDSNQYDCFKTGANKRRNSLLLEISTAGVSTRSPCYARQKDIELILDGTVPDDRIFGIIYTIDPEVDWTTQAALEMACPNLGISNDAEALAIDQAEAVRNPAKQNIFRCKHLNQWMSATSSWMNMSFWSKCYDPGLTPESVKGLPCWLGSDLASKLDLSAVVKIFRDDSRGDKPHYYCLTRTYLPEARVNLPEFQYYQAWSKLGWLTATAGSSMDYAVIEADALKDIAAFKAQELCYDARYADQWSLRVSESSGVPRVVVPPSPAALSPAMKELEAAVYDGRFHHDNNPVLNWCMGNVMTRETSAGNYTMPDKVNPESKIDAAVALFIGMTRAMATPAKPKKYQRITFLG